MFIQSNPWRYPSSTKNLYMTEKLTTRNAQLNYYILLIKQIKQIKNNSQKNNSDKKNNSNKKRPVWKVSSFSKYVNAPEILK